jgi:hypothetical protein
MGVAGKGGDGLKHFRDSFDYRLVGDLTMYGWFRRGLPGRVGRQAAARPVFLGLPDWFR